MKDLKQLGCPALTRTLIRISLFVIVVFTTSITTAHPSTHIQKCLEIVKRGRPIGVHSMYEDEKRNYIAIKGIEFGEYKNAGAFITMNRKTAKLSDYSFEMPDGSRKTVSPHDIAMLRGTMYSHKTGLGRIMCIEAPVSGIGSSGNFQKYIALFEFESNRELDRKDGVSAAIVKDPRYK